MIYSSTVLLESDKGTNIYTGGSYDLKSMEMFNTHDIFMYKGKIIPRDGAGNILFGYAGKQLGFTDDEIFVYAGTAQILANNLNAEPKFEPFYYDDPVDHEYIKIGIDMYNIDNK